ncbi:MAG: hypothetical protein HFG68_14745 [Hungatella sp.]|nr:hypothetical protein [Hungatella sp.]
MAYFDSSKNRALWEIRLGELRKEREARQAGGTSTAFEEQAQREMSGTTRVRITYEELLREEAMVSEKSKGKERGARQIGKEKAKVQEHQKEGMRNEMG